VITFLIVFVGAFLYLNIKQLGNPVAQVRIGSSHVRAEIANSREEHEQGLGGRRTLKNGEGMLFVFAQSGQKGFWMKGMHFSIDIIWIYRGKIVDIAPEVPAPASPDTPESQLPRYFPRLPADMVLEVPAGFALAHGWMIGDEVHIRFDKE
jgi:uncharacterized protein